MRIYSDLNEALGEIKRDLAEMGTRVHTRTMQDKVIGGDDQFSTVELSDYIYRVIKPIPHDLPTSDWLEAEWHDRCDGIEGYPSNPGRAYKFRAEVWDEFLHDGVFSYTYSERFARGNQVLRVIDAFRRDNMSRQLYIAMWNAWTDASRLGKQRVPCSLGWLIQYRNRRLNMTYFMRSCDFATHMQNDIALSLRLLQYTAERCEVNTGSFTHYIGSLHVYRKDVANVF